MKILLVLTIFGLFILFNLYIRVRTLGYYRQLVQRRIQFTFSQMISLRRWKDEILPKYPEDQELLHVFRRHMIQTGFLFVAIVLLVLLLLFLFKLQMTY
ncbi:MAG: hypothetical protein IPP06_05785 [Saprospiraceae bacterium]|nr:hypothetical protein [Candidatus Vicinibacter affinis]